MVAITKEEKEQILEKYPNTHFVRTMKQQSSRHHYYCEETPSIMRLLKKIRSSHREGDSSYGFGKENR